MELLRPIQEWADLGIQDGKTFHLSGLSCENAKKIVSLCETLMEENERYRKALEEIDRVLFASLTRTVSDDHWSGGVLKRVDQIVQQALSPSSE